MGELSVPLGMERGDGMKSSAQAPAFFFPSVSALYFCGYHVLRRYGLRSEYKSCWFEQLSILEIEQLRTGCMLAQLLTRVLEFSLSIGSSGVDKNT